MKKVIVKAAIAAGERIAPLPALRQKPQGRQHPPGRVAALDPAAFDANGRQLATVLAAISMLSFLFLYYSRGRPASLSTIALVDLIGLAPLAWAGWHAFQQ